MMMEKINSTQTNYKTRFSAFNGNEVHFSEFAIKFCYAWWCFHKCLQK